MKPAGGSKKRRPRLNRSAARPKCSPYPWLVGFAFDDLRCDDATLDDLLLSVAPACFSFFFASSARTVTATFAVSILYRAAVRARIESLASGCLGL